MLKELKKFLKQITKKTILYSLYNLYGYNNKVNNFYIFENL